MKIKKIGAFAGKFLPPHLGHISEIENSAKLCDELIVVVADNTQNSMNLCERAGLPFISAKMRVDWLKKHFKNNKKIKVIYMCEDDLKAFPDGMKEWSERFKEITKHRVNMKFADETYRTLNEKYFPECEFVCFDRKKVDISATMIRENPKQYLNFIIPEAQVFFKEIIDKKEI